MVRRWNYANLSGVLRFVIRPKETVVLLSRLLID